MINEDRTGKESETAITEPTSLIEVYDIDMSTIEYERLLIAMADAERAKAEDQDSVVDLVAARASQDARVWFAMPAAC